MSSHADRPKHPPLDLSRWRNVPNVLILNADLAKREKIDSLADLVAYAKRNPGKLNMASGGNGRALEG